MAARADPYRQMRFLIEIEDIVKAGFSYCGLPTASSTVIEYREGNELPTPRKLPGLNEYGPLILQTGVTDRSIELFEWRTLVEAGEIAAARRPVAVIILDATGQAAARWELREAWPTHYEAPRLSATADDVAIERLVIAHEGVRRIGLDTSAQSDDDGGRSVAGLPKGGLPRVTWTPEGAVESLRTTGGRGDGPDEEHEKR